MAVDGSEVYAKYISDMAALQEATKGSIESRAMSVMTSASYITGILINAPREYLVVQTAPVRQAIEAGAASKMEALQTVALTNLDLLDRATAQNGAKANLLTFGIALEAGAVISLAVALVIVLIQ